MTKKKKKKHDILIEKAINDPLLIHKYIYIIYNIIIIFIFILKYT